jgi:hypothetical protein
MLYVIVGIGVEKSKTTTRGFPQAARRWNAVECPLILVSERELATCRERIEVAFESVVPWRPWVSQRQFDKQISFEICRDNHSVQFATDKVQQ